MNWKEIVYFNCMQIKYLSGNSFICEINNTVEPNLAWKKAQNISYNICTFKSNIIQEN